MLIRNVDPNKNNKPKRRSLKHTAPEIARIFKYVDDICVTLALAQDGTIYRRESAKNSGYSTAVLETSLTRWRIDNHTTEQATWLDQMTNKYGWQQVSAMKLKAVLANREFKAQLAVAQSTSEPEKDPGLEFIRRQKEGLAKSRVISRILERSKKQTQEVLKRTSSGPSPFKGPKF